MTKLIWHTEKRKINSLVATEDNPRHLTKKQAKDLEKSLKKFNLVDIPACNLDNRIISGHQRVAILKALGRENEEIDVRVPNRQLTEEEHREYMLRANRNLGEWNYDLLANFDEDLLKEVGFEQEELDDIFQLDEPVDDNINIDTEYSRIEKNCKVKSGDLFILGNHRLLAGDCTVKENVSKLLGDEKIELLFTDPPYGIDIVKDNKKIGYGNGRLGFKSAKATGTIPLAPIVPVGQHHKIIGDNKPFNPEFLLNYGKNQIIWGGNYCATKLKDSSCWIVWDKREDIPSNNFADCEIAWTSFKKPSRIYRQLWSGLLRKGDRKTETLKRVHPTQKPVGIHCKILEDFSKENDIILDLYAGSGTLLIASEQTHRKSFNCEIDCVYCQVIIERYIKLTGKEVTREDGVKWEEIKAGKKAGKL